jgi:DNA-binding PadR family transcriptional regulator
MSSDEWASDMVRSSIIMWLYEQPLHGYAIISNIKTRLKRNVSPSLVYPFLRQLEQKGLVKFTLESVGQKSRKVYELTEEGLQLASVLFKRLASLVSIAIEPSLDVCAHCGAKIFEGGHKTLVGDIDTMFCCVHCFHAYEQEREHGTHNIHAH